MSSSKYNIKLLYIFFFPFLVDLVKTMGVGGGLALVVHCAYGCSCVSISILVVVGASTNNDSLSSISSLLVS